MPSILTTQGTAEPFFSEILRSHSISSTRAQGIPRCKIGFQQCVDTGDDTYDGVTENVAELEGVRDTVWVSVALTEGETD